MRLSDFLVRAVKQHVIISNVTNLGWSWNDRKKHADLTSLVDFGCNFDEDGVCVLYRKNKYGPKGGKVAKATIRKLSQCCCAGCHYSVGYLDALPGQIDTLGYIAKIFDSRTGFWRADKGCVLPRQYRSNTCLFHMCNRGGHNKKASPLDLLRGMMYTKTTFDHRAEHTTFPKRFRGSGFEYNLHRWVPYERMKEMLIEENKKKKRKGKSK